MDIDAVIFNLEEEIKACEALKDTYSDLIDAAYFKKKNNYLITLKELKKKNIDLSGVYKYDTEYGGIRFSFVDYDTYFGLKMDYDAKTQIRLNQVMMPNEIEVLKKDFYNNYLIKEVRGFFLKDTYEYWCSSCDTESLAKGLEATIKLLKKLTSKAKWLMKWHLMYVDHEVIFLLREDI